MVITSTPLGIFAQSTDQAAGSDEIYLSAEDNDGGTASGADGNGTASGADGNGTASGADDDKADASVLEGEAEGDDLGGDDESQVTSLTPDYSWYCGPDAAKGTEADPYEIATASQLLGFAYLVNGTYSAADYNAAAGGGSDGTGSDSGESSSSGSGSGSSDGSGSDSGGTAIAHSFAGQYVKLTADIRIEKDGLYTASSSIVEFGTDAYCMWTTHYYVNADAYRWTPIGTASTQPKTANNVASGTEVPFAGTFDGCGHSISGIYTGDGTATTGNTIRVQGLFGYVTGTVKNVNVKSGCIAAHSLAGGIAGFLKEGKIENCTNEAIVFCDGGTSPGTKKEDGLKRAGANGGIVGRASGSAAVPFTVKKCTNRGTVISANSANGGRAAGIIGLVDSGTDYGSVSECLNYGYIDAYQYVGGIVGLNQSTHNIISSCANYGKIQGQSGGMTYVGGIVSMTYSAVKNCYNRGNVHIQQMNTTHTKAAHAGGIVSDYKSTSAYVENCYNTGIVDFDEEYDCDGCSSWGAIVGTGYGYSASAFMVKNCYTSCTQVKAEDYTFVTDLSITGGIDYLTEDAMKASSFLSQINGDGRAFVQDSDSANDGFPVLRFQVNDKSTFEGIKKISDPKLEYLAGQSFDTDSLVIKAVYSDGSAEKITDYKVSKTGALAESDTVITVSGQYEGISYSFDFNITVIDAKLKSLSIVKTPDKWIYEANECFDPSGMKVKVVYVNGTSAEFDFSEGVPEGFSISNDAGTVIGTDKSIGADTTAVTVSYKQGNTVSADVSVMAVSEPKKDGEGVYTLAGVKDLFWFAYQINEKDARGINAILGSDIDISGYTWIPAGSSLATAFTGSLDGASHAITIAIDSSDSNQALFGFTDGADIRNLKIKGSVTAQGNAAALVANASDTQIVNVINKASVRASGSKVSGIAAYADDRTVITDCGNDANISGISLVGGIVGKFGEGSADTSVISGVYNTGFIKASSQVGGIAGEINANAVLRNAYNRGIIVSVASSSSEDFGAGGIAGKISSCTLENVYNTGYVGGASISLGTIAGIIEGKNVTLTNCIYLKPSEITEPDEASDDIENPKSASAAAGKADEDVLKENDSIASASNDAMTEEAFVETINGKGSSFKRGATYPLLSWQESDIVSAGAWDGKTVTPVEESDEKGKAGLGYYIIHNGAELAWVAQQVNAGDAGNDFAGKTVLLANDIDLGNCEWTPIGSASVTMTNLSLEDERYGYLATLNGQNDFIFEGTLDGDGHSVTNLSITGEKNVVALIGYLGENAAVKDITVGGTVSGGHFVGGVVAVCGGDLTGITNRVVVSGTGNYVGGVAAEGIGTLTIRDCHNRAYVSNSSRTRSSGRVAGIIGRIDTAATATITECSNTSPITGYQYVAGIIGGQFGNVDVSYCYNTGDITAISFGKAYLAGIAGKLEGGTISYCYNTGNLSDQHWAAGHIRAVGGIAGCEQYHTEGTAITNCYTTGLITLNTSNMTYGTNWIYMLGNISGGNSATGNNTMSYENCYYLEGRIPQGQEDNDDYKLWADIYKADHLIWDTKDITSKTEAEMKSNDFLDGFTSAGYFTEDKNNVNGGYPILYWQSGQEAPEPTAYVIDTKVSGSGNAVIDLSQKTATAGTTVTATVAGMSSDKKVYSVTVTDAAGSDIKVTTVKENETYSFIMPSRNCTVSLITENLVSSGSELYSLSLPEGLDAIWYVDAGSTYLTAGSDGTNVRVSAGATVFISAGRDEDAGSSSLKGISVTYNGSADGSATPVDVVMMSETRDSNDYGVSAQYYFTMPAADTSVELLAEYAAFEVYTQEGHGTPKLVKTYTRDEMVSLAKKETIYYSGYYSETEPFIGKAEQAVTLGDILNNAGVTFDTTDTLEVGSMDGMNLLFTYDKLYGSDRYYYPNIISGADAAAKAEGATKVDAMFVIKGYYARAQEGSVEQFTCDTKYAYRFAFGQTETEFNNGVPDVAYKAVDKMPKMCNKIIIRKPEKQKEETESHGDLNASVWDGYSLDVSWFEPGKTSYYISTPAQLAGLAALVNGIYNSEIDTFGGDTSYIKANWNENDGSGPNGYNMSTSNYCYGDYDFAGATIYLTRDIDMSGGNYMPIGGQYLMEKNNAYTKVSATFNGIFDGNGHSVTVKCDRHCSNGNYGDGSSVGLIGRLGNHDSDAASMRAKNPTVRNVAVYGTIYANRSVGGIVGKIGKTEAANSGNFEDGGIIENCANFASVSNTDAKGCGGIVGAGWNGGIVRNCYNAGNISTTYTCPTGGIVGSNEILVLNCYNVGTISANVASYAMAIGTNNGGADINRIVNCYYLKDSAASGAGYFDRVKYTNGEKESADMKTADFVTTLGSAYETDTNGINNGYPVLSWQNHKSNSGTVICRSYGSDYNIVMYATDYMPMTGDAYFVSGIDQPMKHVSDYNDIFTGSEYDKIFEGKNVFALIVPSNLISVEDEDSIIINEAAGSYEEWQNDSDITCGDSKTGHNFGEWSKTKEDGGSGDAGGTGSAVGNIVGTVSRVCERCSKTESFEIDMSRTSGASVVSITTEGEYVTLDISGLGTNSMLIAAVSDSNVSGNNGGQDGSDVSGNDGGQDESVVEIMASEDGKYRFAYKPGISLVTRYVGDVNADGQTTYEDAGKMVLAATNLITFTGIDSLASDAVGNYSDNCGYTERALRILEYLAGKNNNLR